MADRFKDYAAGLDSPPVGGFAVTPDDAADLAVASRGLNVGAAGAVRVTTVDGSDLTLELAAGGIVPIRVTRVWATGTTAGAIVALY